VAIVAGFKIGRYVGRTLAVPAQSGVEHAKPAAACARALRVHEIEVVLGTAEVAVVSPHAPAEPHSTVERRLHHDHVRVRTRRAEHVRLTELLYLTCNTQQQHIMRAVNYTARITVDSRV